MGIPAVGEVVLVPFPFSDLSATKVRPAIALANVGRGDWAMCQVTSNPYGDPHAIALDRADFAAGGLLLASFARPGKLFTAHDSLVVRSVAKLNDPSFRRILDAVIQLLASGSSP